MCWPTIGQKWPGQLFALERIYLSQFCIRIIYAFTIRSMRPTCPCHNWLPYVNDMAWQCWTILFTPLSKRASSIVKAQVSFSVECQIYWWSVAGAQDCWRLAKSIIDHDHHPPNTAWPSTINHHPGQRQEVGRRWMTLMRWGFLYQMTLVCPESDYQHVPTVNTHAFQEELEGDTGSGY